MKEIIFYRSENDLFLFENKGECLYYDRFTINFDDLFFEVQNAKFVLLEFGRFETGVTAYLQMQEPVHLDFGNKKQLFHEELWKIEYDFERDMIDFKIKYGMNDFNSSSMNIKTTYSIGWFPFWQSVNVGVGTYSKAIVPKNKSEDAFLTYVKTCLTDYFLFFYYNTTAYNK